MSDAATWPTWIKARPTFAREELRAAIRDATRSAWSMLRAAHPDETTYGFGLHPTEDGFMLLATMATEEGTLRRAEEYHEVLGGTVEERARMIRWWDADWPYSCDLPAPFAAVNAMLRSLRDALAPHRARDVDPLVASLRTDYEHAIEALEGEGVFAGIPRERLILGVFGADERNTASSVDRLNPRGALERRREEMVAGEALREAVDRARNPPAG